MLKSTISSADFPFALPVTWPRDQVTVMGSFYEQDVGFLPSDLATSTAYPAPVGITFGQSVTFLGPIDLLGNRAVFALSTAATLMSYTTLHHDWDGEGALAPSQDAVSDALRMLEVAPMEVTAPKPMVLATGDVAIYWDFGDTYAEIGFDGSGTYYAFGSAPGRDPVHLDDLPLAEDSTSSQCQFPLAILDILTWEPLKAAA
jgi:hypothetical protein